MVENIEGIMAKQVGSNLRLPAEIIRQAWSINRLSFCGWSGSSPAFRTIYETKGCPSRIWMGALF